MTPHGRTRHAASAFGTKRSQVQILSPRPYERPWSEAQNEPDDQAVRRCRESSRSISGAVPSTLKRSGPEPSGLGASYDEVAMTNWLIR